MTYYTYTKTPAGTVLLVADGKTLNGIYWKNFIRTPKIASDWIKNEKVFAKVIKQLDEYFAGKRKSFDIKYSAQGTDFQKKVWRYLSKMKYGKSVSYKDIAKAVGKPHAVRAVGTAVGSNPFSIIVPCHRVLTAGNKLGGYAGGLSAKKVLLKREGINWE